MHEALEREILGQEGTIAKKVSVRCYFPESFWTAFYGMNENRDCRMSIVSSGA
jgi:hypothetical protein